MTTQRKIQWIISLLFVAFFAYKLIPFSRPSEVQHKRPIAQGRQTYFGSGGGPGPKITQVVIDPFDPKRGENQEIIISIAPAKPAKAVRITMKTDTRETTYELQKIASTSTDALWRGSWKIEDLHDTRYNALIYVEGTDSTSSAELTLR